jgi:uncharacterized membrane protein YagU involved in acid resistance
MRLETTKNYKNHMEEKMATTIIVRSRISLWIRHLTAGLIAGLGGGVVFGMLMAMMGMLPMVAMLVKSQSPIVGLIVHLGISAFIGAVYGLFAGQLPRRWGVATIAGLIYGVIWWVLGALIAMPLGLGMTQMVLVILQTQWYSLMGHLIYGIVTALLFIPLSKRI